MLLELFAGLAPSAAGGTAGPGLPDEGDEVQGAGDPHEGQHAGADLGLDVQVVGGVGEDVAEDEEHDGGDDGGDDGEEGRDEGEEEEGAAAQEDKRAAAVRGVRGVGLDRGGDALRGTRRDGQRGEEDEHKGQHGGGDEETEHPVGGDAGDLEGIADVGGESDWDG